MNFKQLNRQLQKFIEHFDLNEISYEKAREVNKIRKNTLDDATKNFQQTKEKLDNTPDGRYSVDPQSKKREKAEKDFKQARDFQRLAKHDYDKNQKLFEPKEKQYQQECKKKARKFFELKDKYVDKIINILEADGWDLTESEVVHGYDVEYTYKKYNEELKNDVFCRFCNDDEFYTVDFSVAYANHDNWDECRLCRFVELPNHPIYPEKMDYLSLDPRYDGPTAEDEWQQYIDFVQNTLNILKNPTLL